MFNKGYLIILLLLFVQSTFVCAQKVEKTISDTTIYSVTTTYINDPSIKVSEIASLTLSNAQQTITNAQSFMTFTSLLIAVFALIAGSLGYKEIKKREELKKELEKEFQELKLQFKERIDQTNKEIEEIKTKNKEACELTDKIRDLNKATVEKARELSEIRIDQQLSPEEKEKLNKVVNRLDLLESLDVFKPSADAFMTRGNKAYNDKDYEKALECFNNALDLNSQNSRTWNMKAAALNNLNLFEEALKACDKAIEVNPKNVNAWNNTGYALMYLQHYEKALVAYDKALEIDSQYFRAWYNKSCCYALMNQKEECFKSLKKVIELDIKYRSKAKDDKDFNNVRDDPEFNKIIGEE